MQKIPKDDQMKRYGVIVVVDLLKGVTDHLELKTPMKGGVYHLAKYKNDVWAFTEEGHVYIWDLSQFVFKKHFNEEKLTGLDITSGSPEMLVKDSFILDGMLWLVGNLSTTKNRVTGSISVWKVLFHFLFC